MDKKEFAEKVKKELFFATQDGYSDELGFRLLDDGTLAAQTYTEDGAIDKTFVVNISIGRELTKEEWQEP